MNSTPSSIHMRSVIDRGCKNESIVWAKLVGHKHWPAKIISDELRRSRSDYQQADSFKKESDEATDFLIESSEIAMNRSEGAVWAKLLGHKHWPAKIISDELRQSRSDYQQADSFKKESDRLHFLLKFNRNCSKLLLKKRICLAPKVGVFRRISINRL